MLRSRHVALHGAVYGTNFGDVLIQSMLAHHLERSVSARVHVPFGTIEFSDASGLALGGRWPRVRTRAAILGPGGYLGERPNKVEEWHERFLGYHARAFTHFRDRGIPLLLFGVGVGPLSDDRTASVVAEMFAYCEHAYVRDAESAAAATELGAEPSCVSVVPDIAVGVAGWARGRGVPLRDGPSSRVRVGLHLPVSAADRDQFRVLFEDVVTLVQARADVDFVLLEDNPRQATPRELLEAFESLPNVGHVPYRTVEGLVGDISKCSVVVSTKLHVAICAAGLEALPIGVFGHPKVSRFFAQTGRPEAALDVRYYEEGWLPAQVATACDEGVPDEFSTTVDRLRSDVAAGVAELSRRLAALW